MSTIGAVGISATNGIAGADVSFTMKGIEDDVTIGEGSTVAEIGTVGEESYSAGSAVGGVDRAGRTLSEDEISDGKEAEEKRVSGPVPGRWVGC